MALHTLTIRLPDPLYQQVEQRARQMQRSVEDELVAVVAATLPTLADLPTDIASEIAQLEFLSDDELWQVARTTLSPDESERMQELTLKQQRDGLTPQEQQEAEALLHQYDRTMLVRAQAAALLKERGHDVSTLRTPVSPS